MVRARGSVRTWSGTGPAFALALGLNVVSGACTKAAAVETTVSVAGEAYDEVRLGEVTDFDGLARTYSSLRQDIDLIKSDRKDPAFAGTRVYFGRHPSKDGGASLFLLVDGGLYCGSGGCNLTVYRRSAARFTRGLSLLVSSGSPIHVSPDGKSVLVCGRGRRVLWETDHPEKMPVPVAGDRELKPCQ